MLYLYLAYKKIISDKMRLFSTVLGIVIVTVIMHISMAFSNAYDVFDKTEDEGYLVAPYGVSKRILLREISYSCASVKSQNEVPALIWERMSNEHPELVTRWGTMQSFDRLPANFFEYVMKKNTITGICVRAQEELLADALCGEEYPFSMPFADAVDTRFDTFSKNALDSLIEEDGNGILFGRDFLKDEKRAAIISDYTLAFLEKTADDLLGQCIVIKKDNKEEAFRIVGIYDHLLSEHTWNKNLEEVFHKHIRAGKYSESIPDVIFSMDVIKDFSPVGNYDVESVTLTVDDISNVLSVREEIDRAFNIQMNCTYTQLAGIKANMGVYNHMFIALGGIATLTSVIMLFSSLTRVIDDQKESFVIYNLLGMKKRQVSLIIFCQSLVYGLIGWGIGCAVGIGGTVIAGGLLLLGTPEFQSVKSLLPSFSTMLMISALFWAVMLFLALTGVLFGRNSLKRSLEERNGEKE